MMRRPPRSTLLPDTTLFRSAQGAPRWASRWADRRTELRTGSAPVLGDRLARGNLLRSEEHTSELQSRQYLVCRLLLEKKTAQPNGAPQHRFAGQTPRHSLML